MKIYKLHSKSPSGLIGDASVLLTRQMKALGEKHSREEVETILRNTFKRNSRAHTIIITESRKSIGVCFFNICAGVQSGGNYIWINEIYVESEYRGQGYGTAMLEYVEELGNKYNCKYIAAQTGRSNKSSQKLFAKSGFGGTSVVWMDKKI